MAVARQDITDVTKWPEAVTTLRDEHRYMSLLLDALEEKIQGEDEIPAPDYFLIHDVVRYMHEYPDAVHHPTEDLMFDKLVARDPATKSAVRDLQRDHEKLTGNTDRILKLLRAAEVEQSAKASNAVREACNLYIDRLRAHMQTEESELFPRAIDRLAPWDWKIIERRLDDVDDPLFGRTVDSRFRVLFEYFSGQAGDVSRRITLLSFLNFDSFIESADYLERGAGEMIVMFKDEAGSVIDEGKEMWQQTINSRDLAAIVSNPCRYMLFLGKKSLTVGSAASGICWKTAKQMVAPFLSWK
jgi:hemerythrin-like domain-containing protein